MNQISVFSLADYQKMVEAVPNRSPYFFLRSDDVVGCYTPYRADCYSIAYLREGTVDIFTGESLYHIQAPAVITLAPTVIRSFQQGGKALNMAVIFFEENFFIENQADIFYLMKYHFFERAESHVLQLDHTQQIRICAIFDLIEQKLSTPGLNEGAIIRSLIYGLIYEIEAGHRMVSDGQGNEIAHHPLFLRFRQLLSRDFLRQRSVSYYAQELNITPKYLTLVLKKLTGKTTRRLIDEIVIKEARVLLQNAALTVAQIADALNFTDQSTFGKFFKANTGYSPLVYRKLQLVWNYSKRGK